MCCRHPEASAPNASMPLSFTKVASNGHSQSVHYAMRSHLPRVRSEVARQPWIVGRASGSTSAGGTKQHNWSNVKAAKKDNNGLIRLRKRS